MLTATREADSSTSERDEWGWSNSQSLR
jgi:hypothetical protein